MVDKPAENLWRRAKRVATVLIEENGHLRQFDVTFSEAQETELVARAMRDQGCDVEVRSGNRLHVTCKQLTP